MSQKGARKSVDIAPRAANLPVIDGRSRLARVFRRTRGDVMQSLGGPEALSAQQVVAVRLLAEAEALRAVEFHNATRGEAIDKAAWAAYASVTQRSLNLLGMKRVAKDVTDLHEYMRKGGSSAG